MDIIRNVCHAVWDCIVGLGRAFWLMVKAAWEVIDSVTDFLAAVFDGIIELIARGVAKVIIFFFPKPDRPLPNGFNQSVAELGNQLADKARQEGSMVPLTSLISIDQRKALMENRQGHTMSFGKQFTDPRFSAHKAKGYAVVGC